MTGDAMRGLRDTLGLAIAYSTLLILALVGNSTIIVIYFKWKATFKIYKVTSIYQSILGIIKYFIIIDKRELIHKLTLAALS